MSASDGVWLGSMVLETTPAVVAQGTVNPAAVLDASPAARAAASFVLVTAFGAAALYWREDLVDRAIESSMERPLISVVYGTMAYILVTFLSGYAFSQVAQLGVGGEVLPLLGVAVGGSAILSLAGLGYVVVGGRLTEVRGQRSPWLGLAVGAAISGVALALPGPLGIAVWIAIAAVGIGGPTRNYIHDSRSAEIEAEA